MILRTNILLLLLVLSFQTFSQSKYKKGYFIKKSGDRMEVFIKNEDWKGGPLSVEYKISEGASKSLQNTLLLKEFGVYGASRYIIRNLPVDISTKTVNQMDGNKYPVWKQKDVVLSVDIEGKYSLYTYYGEGIKRYYYSRDDSQLEALVYKQYLGNNSNLLENNEFRQQLFNLFSDCTTSTAADVKNVSYGYKSLSKVFVKNNECVNSSAKIWKASDKSDFVFHLKPKVGVVNHAFDISHVLSEFLGGDFGSQTGYRVALELEAIAPFYNRSFALFFELGTTPGFENTQVVPTSIPDRNQEVVFVYDNSFDLGGGIRYYIPLSETFALSVEGGYQIDYIKELSFTYELSTDFQTENISVRSFYGGVSFHAYKFALNVRIPINKELTFINNGPYRGNLKGINATLSYEIF